MRIDVYLAAVAADRSTAEACCAALKARGLSCAASRLVENAELAWDELPAATIARAGLVVLLFSSHAKKSAPLEQEITEALLHSLPVEVLCLDETAPSKRMAELLAGATWDLLEHVPDQAEVNHWADSIQAHLKPADNSAGDEISLSEDAVQAISETIDIVEPPPSPQARPARPAWVKDLHNSLEEQLARDPAPRLANQWLALVRRIRVPRKSMNLAVALTTGSTVLGGILYTWATSAFHAGPLPASASAGPQNPGPVAANANRPSDNGGSVNQSDTLAAISIPQPIAQEPSVPQNTLEPAEPNTTRATREIDHSNSAPFNVAPENEPSPSQSPVNANSVVSSVSRSQTSTTPLPALPTSDNSQIPAPDKPRPIASDPEPEIQSDTKPQSFKSQIPDPKSQILTPAQPSEPDDSDLASVAASLQTQHQWAKAVNVLDHILQRHPRDVDALDARGRSLLAQGLTNVAQADFSRELQFNPQSARAQEGLAETLAAQGDTTAALSAFDTALRLDPSFSPALVGRGRLYIARRQLPEALDDFNQAAHLQSNVADAYAARAYLFLLTDDPGQILVNAQYARQIDPDNVQARITFAALSAAHGQCRAALQGLEHALTVNPRSPAALGLRGSIRVMLGQDKSASDDFRAALRLDPSCREALLGRARLYRRRGNLDAALADCDAAAAGPESVELYALRASLDRDQGQVDRAQSDCRDALRVNPRSPLAWLTMAAEQLAIGDAPSALHESEMAIEADSNCAPAFALEARACLENNQPERAHLLARQALKIDPDSPFCLATQGMTYHSDGDEEEALKWADRAVAVNGADPAGYYLRAEIHLSQDQNVKALADANHALRINPQDVLANLQRCRAHRAAGDPSEAAADLRNARQVNPGANPESPWPFIAGGI